MYTHHQDPPLLASFPANVITDLLKLNGTLMSGVEWCSYNHILANETDHITDPLCQIFDPTEWDASSIRWNFKFLILLKSSLKFHYKAAEGMVG